MKKLVPFLMLACLGLVIRSAASPVLNQNFESGFGTWSHTVTGGGGGWAITSGTTNTGLGAIPAHSHYALVNEALLSGSAYNNPATLTTPTFSLVGMTAPYLAFDQYYFQAALTSGLAAEQAWIQISTDGGATYTTIDTIRYNGYPGSSFNTNWVTVFQSLGSVTATANCVLQFVYKDNGGDIIGLALDNILVYDAAQTDLAYLAVTPSAGSAQDYFAAGSAVTFSGTLINYSNTAVSSFVASYKIGTGAVVNNTISTSIPALGSATFNYTTGYTVPAANQFYAATLWVKATGDTNPGNDSITSGVEGVNFTPKKRVLFEEGTGTWCGYCVRGIVFMDSLWKLYPNDVSIISVHDFGGYDPMAHENTTTQNYDTWVSSQISGYPSMVIDRSYTDDPSGALIDYNNTGTSFGFANMGITATTTGGQVKATVTVEPALNLSGDYRLALVVEEDSVYGTGSLCSSGWGQHDYYGNTVECGVSNGAHSLPLYGCGYNFNDSNTVIPPGSIHFPFVARWTIPNDFSSAATTDGISGSLPATLHAGNVYTYADSVPIASDWVASHLRVVAMLIDNNTGNPTYKQVLNSVNTSSSPYAYINDGVKNVNAGIQDMKVFPNPASNLAHVLFTLNDVSTVQFSVYDAVGHQVFGGPTEQMNAGEQQINFSTANLPSGIYNVVVRTQNGTLTQRLSVIK